MQSLKLAKKLLGPLPMPLRAELPNRFNFSSTWYDSGNISSEFFPLIRLSSFISFLLCAGLYSAAVRTVNCHRYQNCSSGIERVGEYLATGSAGSQIPRWNESLRHSNRRMLWYRSHFHQFLDYLMKIFNEIIDCLQVWIKSSFCNRMKIWRSIRKLSTSLKPISARRKKMPN